MNLLKKYHKGIAKVTPELYDEVKQRSNGICEICNQRRAEEVHHLVGRRRVACIHNLIDLCISCHKPPNGIHAKSDIYETQMKKLQDKYFLMGFNEDEVRYLLGTKSMKLF